MPLPLIRATGSESTPMHRADGRRRQEAAVTRTPLEIAQHHGRAVAAGDIDDVLADYTDESVMITPRTARSGAGTEPVKPGDACSRTCRTQNSTRRVKRPKVRS